MNSCLKALRNAFALLMHGTEARTTIHTGYLKSLTEEVCGDLNGGANEAGGRDNTTAVTSQFGDALRAALRT